MSPEELACAILEENLTGDISREELAKRWGRAKDSQFAKALEECAANLEEPLFSEDDLAAFKAASDTGSSKKFREKMFAQDDYLDWFVLNERAISLCKRGEPLQPEVRDFIVARLRGESKRPSHAKGSREGEAFQLAFAVAYLCKEYDIHPTRNPLSQGNSACDFVSCATAKVDGFHYSRYETVKKAWLKHKTRAEHIYMILECTGVLECFVGGEF